MDSGVGFSQNISPVTTMVAEDFRSPWRMLATEGIIVTMAEGAWTCQGYQGWERLKVPGEGAAGLVRSGGFFKNIV